MRIVPWVVAFFLTCSFLPAAEKEELQGRRQKAAAALPDGILIVHAKSALETTGDGFRQDAAFYYFTALEDTASALLAIDGRSRESWLFLPAHPPFSKIVPPEISPGSDSAGRSGIEHVVDWSELDGFLAKSAAAAATLYYVGSLDALPELPANLISSQNAPGAPLWALIIARKWPSLQLKAADKQVDELMAVQGQSEIVAVRAAAKATVSAVLAGMRAIKPGASQRAVEAAVQKACWDTGAHGSSFWPWAMAGQNGLFPYPFVSTLRYDHLNVVMQAGDLVRLDVGCESDHYQGDLGRTVPVSGHFSDDQRETWNIFVAAYQAGVKSLHEGITVDQVFAAWRAELLRFRPSAKSALAQQAIEQWSKRENVPFWQVHTINLATGGVRGPLRAGTTIAFEPIASIGRQGYYLEDMFLITRDGSQLLTPGVPYSADEIEAAVR